MARLVAIGFIWVGCAIAWMVLGSTLLVRSGETSAALNEEVRLLWGPPITQAPPTAYYVDDEIQPDKPVDPPPKPPLHAPSLQVAPPAGEPTQQVAVPIDSSDITVGLALEHRKKGLLWFATYTVDFSARYAFANPTDTARELVMSFPLAGDKVVYDAFNVTDAAGEPVDATVAGGRAVWRERLSPGERREYQVVYRSRGTSSWQYATPQGTSKIKDFSLELRVNTPHIDFPAGTLSPSSHAADGDSWSGTWAFDSLVSSAPIGVELPKKLNPGPVASRITFFAPVSLLFFFFVVAVLAAARGKRLHPMHYLLLGCSFFAFHLMFAYLVDHVPVFASFGIAAVVSLALVVSYARLFVGWRFALMEMGISQLVYLVLFSFTFFWQGFTGLAVTIGAVLTLFVIMQITGRIDWSEAMRVMRRPAPEPMGPAPMVPR